MNQDTPARSVDQPERRDFFISYASSDKQWAEWIGNQLEGAGYGVILEAWDFRPGMNVVLEADQAISHADCVLLVLSRAYLESYTTSAQWSAAFQSQRRLLPVRVEQCEVGNLLGPLVSIDLVALAEVEARERLLAGVSQKRLKPANVAFPRQATVAFPGPFPATWMLLQARNPFFLGHDNLLESLHHQFQTTQSQPQAISGLGGVGKTQLAVEYAYRYHHEYQAVLWARAETMEALNASYIDIAKMLNLPQKYAQEQESIIQAVKHWLRTHQDWLLILDNADEPQIIPAFLPPQHSGHLLLTTRAQTPGKLIRPLPLDTLDQQSGALLLLRRARLIAPDAPFEIAKAQERTLAIQLTTELGGLPLALDQAAAYIEETTCGLASYLRQYQTRRTELLAQRGMRTEDYAVDHPDSVATTWSISFQKVAAASPLAANLLRLCAFLAPDAIPEILLMDALKSPLPVLNGTEQSQEWDGSFPHLTEGHLDKALALLRVYSLIQRNPVQQAVSVHRLVQIVLRDGLPTVIQQRWMQRAILAVNAAFPDVEFTNWQTCERLLSHAQVCASWIKQPALASAEAALLLNQAGYYLCDRGRYMEAKPLYLKALEIREQQLGVNHPQTAQSLNNLAILHQDLGEYTEAEPLFRQALAISRQVLGENHPYTAASLNNLARLYDAQGWYTEAESLYLKALEITRQVWGDNHLHTAKSLNNLAGLYDAQGKYAEAEPLLKRALEIVEQQLGADHPDTALVLNNLGEHYDVQGWYAEAEPLYQRALVIREQQLGLKHPDTALSLNNLALLYKALRSY